MYQNHAKAIKGLGIAIIVLAALTIAGCLLGLAFTVFSGSMAATFVPYSYNDASIAADMHEAGLSDDEAIALFTMVFGMIGAGLVWAALCSVFVLVAGIKALGAANDPAKLKGAMAWNIVGAVASFLGHGALHHRRRLRQQGQGGPGSGLLLRPAPGAAAAPTAVLPVPVRYLPANETLRGGLRAASFNERRFL